MWWRCRWSWGLGKPGPKEAPVTGEKTTRVVGYKGSSGRKENINTPMCIIMINPFCSRNREEEDREEAQGEEVGKEEEERG